MPKYFLRVKLAESTTFSTSGSDTVNSLPSSKSLTATVELNCRIRYCEGLARTLTVVSKLVFAYYSSKSRELNNSLDPEVFSALSSGISISLTVMFCLAVCSPTGLTNVSLFTANHRKIIVYSCDEQHENTGCFPFHIYVTTRDDLLIWLMGRLRRLGVWVEMVRGYSGLVGDNRAPVTTAEMLLCSDVT